MIRSQILSQIPSWSDIQLGEDLSIKIAATDIYAKEIERYMNRETQIGLLVIE
jgi:hypothetical protein